MTYLIFQFKKIIKSKFSILSIGLVLALLLVILLQNARAQPTSSSLSVTKSNISYIKKKQMPATKVQLSQAAKGSAKYNAARADYQSEVQELKFNQKVLAAINAAHWQSAYHLLKWHDQKMLNSMKRSSGVRDDTNQASEKGISKNIARLSALAKANLAEDNEDFPRTGLLFILSTFDYIIPLLLSLIVIFILTKLLAAKYVDKLDISSLYPVKNLQGFDFLSGTLLSWVILAVVLLLIFIVASILFGVGQINYPTAGINLQTGRDEYLPLIQRLIPTLVLALLVLTFITAAVMLIVQIFKKQLNSLLVGVLFLIGGALLPRLVAQCRPITQYLPTTYFFSLQTINGNMAATLANAHVTFTNGVIVLLIWIIGLLVLNLIYSCLGRR